MCRSKGSRSIHPHLASQPHAHSLKQAKSLSLSGRYRVAMQKVDGSSPFIRFGKSLVSGLFVSSAVHAPTHRLLPFDCSIEGPTVRRTSTGPFGRRRAGWLPRRATASTVVCRPGEPDCPELASRPTWSWTAPYFRRPRGTLLVRRRLNGRSCPRAGQTRSRGALGVPAQGVAHRLSRQGRHGS